MLKDIRWSFIATLLIGVGVGINFGLLWGSSFSGAAVPPGAFVVCALMELAGVFILRPPLEWLNLRPGFAVNVD